MVQTVRSGPCPIETSSQLLKWLPAGSSDLCGDEVLWETCRKLHHLLTAPIPGPAAVCAATDPWMMQLTNSSTLPWPTWTSGGENYVKMLFVDYSSAFNTIIPSRLVTKLEDLGLNSILCSWIINFLMGRPQVMWVDSHTSSLLTINTGTPPQRSVLSPLLCSLYTLSCVYREQYGHVRLHHHH